MSTTPRTVNRNIGNKKQDWRHCGRTHDDADNSVKIKAMAEHST
jgi:hypothetical protein